ncbi:MAG: hypothetical protein Q9M29_09855 [Mariprofundaceae bacterium]|nr:hypothetical protein [Mariprofundaceae bacterium]
MKQYILLIFVCLGWVGTATAGIVVTSEHESGIGKMERSQAYYEGNKSRHDDFIFLGREIITIDNGAKAYWQGSPEQFCKVMKKLADAISALVPPQYRSKPISQRKVTRRKIGTRSIAGFTATGYQFFVDGESDKEVWVSDDAGLSELIRSLEAAEKEVKKIPACKGGSSLQDSKLYRETVKGRFVLDDGHEKVVKVEKKRISASVFSAPKGYRKFTDYEQFTEYVKTHQQARKSGPSSGRAMSPPPSASGTPPPVRREVPPPERREPATVDDDAGDDSGIPGMDELKEGIGGMLKSIW